MRNIKTRKKVSDAQKAKGVNHPSKRPEVKAKISGENSPTKRLEVREKISKNHADFSGNRNPNYIDGSWCSKENPYCIVWKERDWKDHIKYKRDRNKCWSPYCNGRHTNKLTLHHINYDKKDCNGENLITLCTSCNARANKDRAWHQAWYTLLMEKRGY
jgi:hypothetical protein